MSSPNKVKVENKDTRMSRSQYDTAGKSTKLSNQSTNKLVNLAIPKSLAQKAPVVVRTYVECISFSSFIPFVLR